MKQLLRVAVLVDLSRSPTAGGHVKCWERIAAAAVGADLPLALTVYFSGDGQTEVLGAHTFLAHLPPLFSTRKLAFLPYVPDHTDLAPYHPRLAAELADYDLIHTTDAFFAFARTAEAVARRRGVPLVTSFHTDAPSYTRIFTRQSIEQRLRSGWARRRLIDVWQAPERQGRRMDRRLVRHLLRCDRALAAREADRSLSEAILGASRVSSLRLGVDKQMFSPALADRAALEAKLGIAPDQILILFVGRLDVGKNIHTLIEAVAHLRTEGLPLHLITAGIGPAAQEVRQRLGTAATVVGFVPPAALGSFYASVDVTAMPSEVEIHGMVELEALASGCPVLVSAASGVASLFEGVAGLREVEGGVEGWIADLRRICQDDEGRAEMRAAAAGYRPRLASWEDVVTEDLFVPWKSAFEASARRQLAA